MNTYENIKQYLIDRKLFSNEILLDYIKYKIYEYELENFISSIKISDNLESGFNMKNNLFTLNPNEILCEVQNKKMPNIGDIISKRERKTGIIDNPNSVNLYNIFVSRHELEHVLQKKISYDDYVEINSDNCFNVWKLILMEKDFITSYYDEVCFNNYFYNKYHDYFFLEYSANIESYLETIYLINAFNIPDLKDILTVFNNIVAKNLLYLYHDVENTRILSTPSKNALKLHKHLLKLMKKSDIEIIPSDFSIYKGIDTPKDQIDRLRIGLSITDEVLRHLYNVAKGKEKRLNLFDDIRNI